ncbi:MAG: 4'-phosphopantetheinyl transferase superfamily protein [Patescibacteria group bacterium]|jgi:4'-phosphopantetheinyl transferase
MVYLYLYEKVNIPSDIYRNLLNYTSDYSKKSILQKWTYKEKCTAIIDDFLLREFMYKNYRLRYDNDEIITNEFGKPFFRKQKGYYFNFSHNDKYGVLVLGEDLVGADIEEIERINTKTKSIFVSDRDYFSKVDTKLSLCKLWTAKESYCKAIGCGLNISLKEVNVVRIKNNIKIGYREKSKKWFVKYFELDGKTEIAVCSIDQFSLKYSKINILEYLSTPICLAK